MSPGLPFDQANSTPPVPSGATAGFFVMKPDPTFTPLAAHSTVPEAFTRCAQYSPYTQLLRSSSQTTITPFDPSGIRNGWSCWNVALQIRSPVAGQPDCTPPALVTRNK